jgi:hypothetical protein
MGNSQNGRVGILRQLRARSRPVVVRFMRLPSTWLDHAEPCRECPETEKSSGLGHERLGQQIVRVQIAEGHAGGDQLLLQGLCVLQNTVCGLGADNIISRFGDLILRLLQIVVAGCQGLFAGLECGLGGLERVAGVGFTKAGVACRGCRRRGLSGGGGFGELAGLRAMSTAASEIFASVVATMLSARVLASWAFVTARRAAVARAMACANASRWGDGTTFNFTVIGVLLLRKHQCSLAPVSQRAAGDVGCWGSVWRSFSSQNDGRGDKQGCQEGV